MNTTTVTGSKRKTRGGIRRKARLFPELACLFMPIGMVVVMFSPGVYPSSRGNTTALSTKLSTKIEGMVPIWWKRCAQLDPNQVW